MKVELSTRPMGLMSRDPATFRIARNPDADSTLPYLLWVPLGANPLVLKAKDTWPRTAKVYCHRGEWPAASAIVEETPVRSCGAGLPSTSCSTVTAKTGRSLS